MSLFSLFFFFFFFNDTATTEIYTLSLHDALPIYHVPVVGPEHPEPEGVGGVALDDLANAQRSEEHTSELQSRPHLVCRLLLEKKKKNEDASAIALPRPSRRRLTCGADTTISSHTY